MPTDIYFAAENVAVRVDEDPSQVAEAFSSADGRPVLLTREGGRGEVYVNTGTVAFWGPSEPGPDKERPEDSPGPAVQRDTVTDIWGNPISKTRRR